MQTSYEVGAVLRLVDEASPVLRLLSEKFEAFDKLVSTTQKSLSRLGSTKIGELGGSINSVTEKLSKIGSGAEGAANKLKGAFQSIDASATDAGRKMSGFETSIKAIGEQAGASFEAVATGITKADAPLTRATDLARSFKEELQGAGLATREIPRLPGIGGGSGGGRGGRGGGGHHEHDGRHGRIRTTHGERPNETGPHGAYIDAGVMGTIGFHEFAHAVEMLVEGGAKLEKFQAQLEAATGSAATVAQATAAAWDETSRNLTTSVSENLKNIHHLMNVTGGGVDEATKLLHPFTMADTMLGSIKDESIAGAKGSKALEMNTYNFARSLEQLGVTNDEDKLQSYTANLTRMMIGMRGLVDGSKLFQGINNAGGSRYAWDEDFVTYGLGPLLQATNGRAGAQLYQLSRSYGQGVSTEQMAINAEKYGLWQPKDELRDSKGHFKGMAVGSIWENDVLRADPVKWAGDLREMLRGRGLNVDDTAVMTGVIAEITRGNKNLGAIMDELVLPNTYAALMKERKNIEAVPKDAVDILQKQDPGVAMKAFNEQFENLLTALGKPTVAQVADTLNALAHGMNTLAQFFDAHPTLAKDMVGMAAGVTAGLGAIAILGLAAFAPGGLIAVAAAALTGALTGLAAVNWEALKNLANSMGLSMDNFHHNIADISGAFDQINAVLTKFFTGLLHVIENVPLIGPVFKKMEDEALLNGYKTPTAYDREARARRPGQISVANPNGAPYTPQQKAWMLQHPGQDMPANLVPSPRPLSPAEANRFGHTDGFREGTDRLYHRLSPQETQDFAGRLFPGVPAAAVPVPVPAPVVPGAFHPSDDDRSTRARAADSEAWRQQQDMIRAASQQFGALNANTGLVLTSFDGLDKGAVAVNDNFTAVGTGSAGFKNALDILTATAIGAARALAQVALAGGFGAGGDGNGIINASWGGGGFGGGGGGGSWGGNALAVNGGFGNAGWEKSGASRPEVADYIKAKAAELGIDPNVALRVSQSEGFNTYTGDYGTSFGPFQLHYGGSGIRGMNSGGLGDRFTAQTGKSARDPTTWKAQVDYALGVAKREGWEAWHGAAHVGIGNRQGLDWHGAKPAPTVSGPPPKKSTPGSPASDKPMVSAQNDATHNHHIYLDGRKIAQVVTKHQAAAMRFPTDMGGPDAHGSFVSPGTPVTDAA